MVTWSNTPTHETPTLGTSVLQIVLIEDLTRRIASPDVIVSCPEWRVALTLKEPVPVIGNPTPSSVLSALGDLPETPRFTSTLAVDNGEGPNLPILNLLAQTLGRTEDHDVLSALTAR
jgi:hypothetical protein